MAKTKLKGGDKKKGQLVSASKDASRDVLSRTGMGVGSDFVDSASGAMASYGRVLVPMLALAVLGFSVYYYLSRSSADTELQLRNRIDRAAMVVSLDELHGGMEAIVAETDEARRLADYARYRYAVRAYQLLERPYRDAELGRVIGVLDDYLERFGEAARTESWNRHVRSLRERLAADQAFLQRPESRDVLPWTRDSKADVPDVRLIEPTEGNPVVVFVTSVGVMRVELFEDDAPNAVYHFLSLCGEGFFDRTTAQARSFSNAVTPDPLFRDATIISAGRQGRPAGARSDNEGGEDKDEDIPLQANPYSIDYQGSPVRAFRAGSIALARDGDDPTRARSEFIVVVEPSATLAVSLAPLGQILDGEQGLAVARALHNADIYYTYVEQKRRGVEYRPLVYYDGWPVPTRKRDKAPDPVRFSALEPQVSPLNPLVVLELEKGDIVIQLFEDVTPNTVANFINLVKEGFYDQDCSFYRVEGRATNIAEIYKENTRIIQGGYSQTETRDGYDYSIVNEAIDNPRYDAAGLGNRRGTIAMARLTDPDTASTEFFINLKDHPDWDKPDSKYCVFGEVIHGLDLAALVKKDDKILSVRVIRHRGHDYIPEVRYRGNSELEPKRPVEIPKSEDD